MHRATWLTVFACTLGLSLSASLPAGESNQVPPDLSGKTRQAFCWSSHNEYREPAIYFSDVFEIRIPKNAGRWFSIDMARVFAAHLTAKHGYVSPVPLDGPSERLLHANIACSLHDTAQAAQGTKDLLIEQHRYYKQPVVETGWKMSAQEAAAAVGTGTSKPAVAAAPPASIYGFCSGNQGAKIYFSAIFSAANEAAPADNSVNKHKPSTDRWALSYNDWLVQEYGFQGTVRCSAFDKLEGAQSLWGRQTQINRNFGPNHHAETGWSYGSAG